MTSNMAVIIVIITIFLLNIKLMEKIILIKLHLLILIKYIKSTWVIYEELITQIIKKYIKYLCRRRRLDSKRQRRF